MRLQFPCLDMIEKVARLQTSWNTEHLIHTRSQTVKIVIRAKPGDGTLAVTAGRAAPRLIRILI